MLKDKIRRVLDEIIIRVCKEYGKQLSEEISYKTEEPPRDISADLSTNIAFLLSKRLNLPPAQVASDIKKEMESKRDLFERVTIEGEGFINFTFSSEILHKELEMICKLKDRYGIENIGKGGKVLIEFVSANPTGPLHVGHGRGAALGDSLRRILKFLGYDVHTEYYINDVGTQVDLLGESVQARYLQAKGKDTHFPERGYAGEYIKGIAKKLEEKGVDMDDVEKIKEDAQSMIMEMIKRDLEKFNCHFDSWFSESSLKPEIKVTLEELKKKKLLYEKDGAWWFMSSHFDDEKDRVAIKGDGSTTYLASDIAYHHDKFERGFNQVINIWGADHHGYVDRVKAAVEAFGYQAEQLKIILYQLVKLSRSGKIIPMSTREGSFITLKEVMDEVGTDVSRFFFLLRSSTSQLDFDLELAKKESPENPVYYVQYAHARISSIFREAKKRKVPYSQDSKVDITKLTLPEELALIKKMTHYPEVIYDCSRNLQPHYITGYLQELTSLFHSYYNEHRVLGVENSLSLARLRLVEGIRHIIRGGLDLLGVSTPESM